MQRPTHPCKFLLEEDINTLQSGCGHLADIILIVELDCPHRVLRAADRLTSLEASTMKLLLFTYKRPTHSLKRGGSKTALHVFLHLGSEISTYSVSACWPAARLYMCMCVCWRDVTGA